MIYPSARASKSPLPRPCRCRGKRHRRLFDLARELKAIPALASADLARLKPIVRNWHQAALPIIRTKPFDETWLDFAESWDKVRFPKGQGPMCTIFSRCGMPTYHRWRPITRHPR